MKQKFKMQSSRHRPERQGHQYVTLKTMLKKERKKAVSNTKNLVGKTPQWICRICSQSLVLLQYDSLDLFVFVAPLCRFGPFPVPSGQLLDFWLALSLPLSGSTGIANSSPTSLSEETKDTLTGHQKLDREKDPGLSQKRLSTPVRAPNQRKMTLEVTFTTIQINIFFFFFCRIDISFVVCS